MDISESKKRLCELTAELETANAEFTAADERRSGIMREIEALRAAVLESVLAGG
jgi:hypothetical protein